MFAVQSSQTDGDFKTYDDLRNVHVVIALVQDTVMKTPLLGCAKVPDTNTDIEGREIAKCMGRKREREREMMIYQGVVRRRHATNKQDRCSGGLLCRWAVVTHRTGS